MAPGRSLRGNYAKFWIATTTSNLGDGVRMAALPLLAVSLTKDPLLVAGLTFASELPWLLFGLVAGALVDRVDQRRAMIAMEVVRAVVMLALAVLVAVGAGHIVFLYVTAFVLGSARTVFDNAAQTMLPSIVDASGLERANGRLYTGELMGRDFGGPPLGGLLFTLGASVPLFVDGSSFAIGAAFLFGLTGLRPSARARGDIASTLRSDVRSGMRWLWNHTVLRWYALILGAVNLLSAAVLSITVLYALEILGIGKVGYGVLLAAGAVGGLVASLVTDRLAAWLTAGPILIASLAAPGVAYLLLGVSSSPAIGYLTFGIDGFAAVSWAVITVSLRQQVVPPDMLGRVNGVYRFVGWGLGSVGALIGGVLAHQFGLRVPIVVAGATFVLLAVVAYPVLRTRTVEAVRAERPPAPG